MMMGGLHIEMASLKMVGHWLKSSGWDSALVQADITTSGRADAILKASHITRSRYALFVRGCVYYCDKANSVESSLQRPRGYTKHDSHIGSIGVHISLEKCVSHRETHITSDMCTGLHISHTFPTHILHRYHCDMYNASSLRSSLPRPTGYITRQPYWKRIHISLVICVSPPGIRISQALCVLYILCVHILHVYYTYIIVTTPVHYVLRCRGQGRYT